MHGESEPAKHQDDKTDQQDNPHGYPFGVTVAEFFPVPRNPASTPAASSVRRPFMGREP